LTVNAPAAEDAVGRRIEKEVLRRRAA